MILTTDDRAGLSKGTVWKAKENKSKIKKEQA